MKKFRLINNLIMSSALLVVPIAKTMISCSSTNVIDGIVLQSETNCIMPSQSVIIKAIVSPSQTRLIKGIVWEIMECPLEGVTISNEGTLTVSATTYVPGQTKIAVKATLEKTPEVYNFIYITVVPYSPLPFCGFVDDEIKYLTRDMQPASMKIIKINDFEYVNEKPIDLFQLDQRTRPEGYDAPIIFSPLISGDSSQYMNFHIFSEIAPPDQALEWDDYEDESWTNTIPDFYVWNCNLLRCSIRVKFACDERVSLTLNFNTWNSPDAGFDALLFYTPEEGNPHSIEMGMAGLYSSFLYCPSIGTTGKYEGDFHSIYCTYGKYMLPDFDFVFIPNPNLDPEIWECFSFTHTIEKIERPIDHYIAYKINFHYEFDLSKRQHTADYWDYYNFYLMTMEVYDKMYDGRICAWDMHLDWI